MIYKFDSFFRKVGEEDCLLMESSLSILQILHQILSYAEKFEEPEKLLVLENRLLYRHLLSIGCMDVSPSYGELLQKQMLFYPDSGDFPAKECIWKKKGSTAFAYVAVSLDRLLEEAGRGM